MHVLKECSTSIRQGQGQDDFSGKRLCKECAFTIRAGKLLVAAKYNEGQENYSPQQQIIHESLNACENWRGQNGDEVGGVRTEPSCSSAESSKKQSLYYGQNAQKIYEKLNARQAVKRGCKTLPILRNGSNTRTFCRLNDHLKYSIQSTSSFDSLFQILLARATDDFNFRFFVSTVIKFSESIKK